jgi:hypothetical protein
MNGNCLDIGTIQAFLDGETSPQESLRVADHIGACEPCSVTLARAEEETAAVFSALDRELDALVPTQRLWSRINDSIAEEKGRASVWTRLLSFVSINLATPAMAAAASFVVILGVVALMWNPNQTTTENIAGTGQRPANLPAAPVITPTGISPDNGSVVASTVTEPSTAVSNPTSGRDRGVVETKYSADQIGKMVAVNASAVDNRRQRPAAVPAVASERGPLVNGYLPGEESYVKTIADLRQNVDGQKDTVMPASTRVKYERDMAVVDDSIKKMRTVVRQNPRNQAARQILYSAYQDKIDLLNSVAQREELMASLK